MGRRGTVANSLPHIKLDGKIFYLDEEHHTIQCYDERSQTVVPLSQDMIYAGYDSLKRLLELRKMEQTCEKQLRIAMGILRNPADVTAHIYDMLRGCPLAVSYDIARTSTQSVQLTHTLDIGRTISIRITVHAHDNIAITQNVLTMTGKIEKSGVSGTAESAEDAVVFACRNYLMLNE